MAKLFHMKYPPPGMGFADARRASLLRETKSWYYKNERNQNVSTGTDNFKKAQAILKADIARRARGEPYVPQASHVTFAQMAERLKQDYDLNGKHRPTLDARLTHLESAFGDRRMGDIRPADVTDYITLRKSQKASNGSVNRELEILSRAFTLGRKLGLRYVCGIIASVRARLDRDSSSLRRSTPSCVT